MANKQKKKRNKRYTGAEASTDRPTVTRISAVHRGKLKQWWFDNKRIARPVIIAAVIVLALIWLTYELIRIANG